MKMKMAGPKQDKKYGYNLQNSPKYAGKRSCGRARLPPITGLIILPMRYMAYAVIRRYLRY